MDTFHHHSTLHTPQYNLCNNMINVIVYNVRYYFILNSLIVFSLSLCTKYIYTINVLSPKNNIIITTRITKHIIFYHIIHVDIIHIFKKDLIRY